MISGVTKQKKIWHFISCLRCEDMTPRTTVPSYHHAETRDGCVLHTSVASVKNLVSLELQIKFHQNNAKSYQNLGQTDLEDSPVTLGELRVLVLLLFFSGHKEQIIHFLSISRVEPSPSVTRNKRSVLFISSCIIGPTNLENSPVIARGAQILMQLFR